MTVEHGSDADTRAIVKETSVTEQVVDSVLDMLRSGRYGVGDRLPSERELIDRFDVGRSAVREATRDLVALGLLEVQRGRGTYVRSLRSDLLLGPKSFGEAEGVSLELLEVRTILEPEAAALAADRRRIEDVTRLEQDVERLEDAVRSGYRPLEDLGFHLDVVNATHNRALARVTGAIVSFYQADQHLPTDDDVVQHRAVFEAIRDQDANRARDVMSEHIAREYDRL